LGLFLFKVRSRDHDPIAAAVLARSGDWRFQTLATAASATSGRATTCRKLRRHLSATISDRFGFSAGDCNAARFATCRSNTLKGAREGDRREARRRRQ